MSYSPRCLRACLKSCILILFFFAVVPPVFAQSPPNISTLYDSLANPVLNESAAAPVENLTITRGGQKLLFTKGLLRLTLPVGGKVSAAVFTGKGTFTLSPPTPGERSEFERETRYKLTDGKYEFAFERCVLWFQDSLLKELGEGMHFAKQDVGRAEKDALERSLKYAIDKSNTDVLLRVITEALEPQPQPYLYATIFFPEKGEICFGFDPRRFEEISVYQPPYEAIAGAVYWLQLVNSFHLPEEYAKASEYALCNEDKKRFDFLSEKIDLTVEQGGPTHARAALHIRSRSSHPATLNFILDPTLKVDSIIGEGGRSLSFHRSEKEWEGIVRLPDQDSLGYSLDFAYHGDFMKPYQTQYGLINGILVNTRKIAGSFYMPASSTGWYPQQDALERVSFDVTYHVPKDLELIAAGRKQEESVENSRKVVRYTTGDPCIINTFGVGQFQPKTVRLSANEPPVTVYDVGGGGDPEVVGKDVANCMRLYTYLFGGTPYTEVRVVGGPEKHGQAFQEFLNLPWFEEIVGEKNGGVAIGRAHEVAHAWWGHGVGWKSYHDLWISEAFANYSALLYAQFDLKQDRPFFDKLKAWKEEIAGMRKYALGSGPQLGSIWLGYRVSTAQTANDYAVSTYLKGAWVLHMIRMMMADLSTLQEDSFTKMMAEFYQTFKGKDASTEDFRAVVEKYFHSDMKWFFDEWVYGTEVPTLKCTHSGVQTASGKYSLKIGVEQKDVSKPFTIYLPFELTFKNGVKSRARLLVDKERNEFSYELDQEPETVSFNVMESVLCPIEE